MTRTSNAVLPAVLFIGTGLLTYQVYYWVAKNVPDEYQLVAQLLTGIPFGLACSLRFVRPWRWIGLTTFLDCVTWVVAYRLGLAFARNAYVSLAFAGLLGAAGVTLSTGIGCKALYAKRPLAVAALLGALAGIPFGIIPDHTDKEDMILAMAFPLWQLAVGLWMWKVDAASASVSKRDTG